MEQRLDGGTESTDQPDEWVQLSRVRPCDSKDTTEVGGVNKERVNTQ